MNKLLNQNVKITKKYSSLVSLTIIWLIPINANAGIDNFTNMAKIGVFITDRVIQNELGGGIDLKNNIWYIPSKN